MNRAREWRGRDDGYKRYYDQGMIEDIQLLHLQFFSEPCFTNIRCTFEFADTAETFGVIQNSNSCYFRPRIVNPIAEDLKLAEYNIFSR